MIGVARRWTVCSRHCNAVVTFRHVQRRYIISPTVQERLSSIKARHAEILAELQSPGASSSQLGKELSSLASAASLYDERKALMEEESAIQELLREAKNDDELLHDCNSELERIRHENVRLEQSILRAVLPKDEDDTDSDAIVEVRAGTGGDEASLFAQEIFAAYQKTAAKFGFSVELLEQAETEIGGIREASMSISGHAKVSIQSEENESYAGADDELLGPYGSFRYESGVHRVQRIPINDSKIQTSACSVAVMPMQRENNSDREPLPLSELNIETMRASGAGGQHVNTTDSAVRITHIPTGLTASIQDERSQHKNKEKAIQLITARVRDQQRRQEQAKRGALRSHLLGGGDRSERIRTYNYPQDRITDHRCKTTCTGIGTLLSGGGLVMSFLPSLKQLHRDELLRELENDAKSNG